MVSRLAGADLWSAWSMGDKVEQKVKLILWETDNNCNIWILMSQHFIGLVGEDIRH